MNVVKVLRQCKHCGRNNHISEKCWEKFGHSEWAQLADADTPASGDNAHIHAPPFLHSSSSGSPIVVLSQEEYDKLRQFEFSQNSHSTTYAFSLGLSAYIASQKLWN